jgi:hypothetical protein
MATAAATGSGAKQGELWGQRPRDWAAIEEQQLPTYEEGIRRAGIQPGDCVLDVAAGPASSSKRQPSWAPAHTGSTLHARCCGSRAHAYPRLS